MTVTQEAEIEFFKENKNTFGLLKPDETLIQDVARLAGKLDNIIIFRKGIVDIISNGKFSYYIAFEGSKKRCGG